MSVYAKLTRGGQISIPAAIRHRWGAQHVAIEDGGDHLIVRPVPDEDPIEAAAGAFADPSDVRSFQELWADHKAEDREAEERKWGVPPPGLKWRDAE